MAKTGIYWVWANMRSRCSNPNKPEYINYGGRGIKVCERWGDFDNFVADMGDRPFKGAQLDRRDNDGDYCLSNCRWVTPKDNLRNKRDNVNLTYDGKTQCLTAWAEEMGIHHKTLSSRIFRSKMPLDVAFSKPLHSKWGKA